MSTIAIILGALGSILGGTSILLHLLAPRTKTLLDDHAAAVIDKLVEKLKAITPALVIALVCGLAVAPVAMMSACAPNTRNATIAVALTTMNGTRDTFEAYDEAHQAELVADATSTWQGSDALAAYRSKRAAFVKALGVAYAAIEAAIRINDDPSVTSMLGAMSRAAAELATLQGATP